METLSITISPAHRLR